MNIEFVADLPDLIQPADYPSDPDGRRVRFRIRRTARGVELLGDAMTPHELEQILAALEPTVVEQMLCG